MYPSWSTLWTQWNAASARCSSIEDSCKPGSAPSTRSKASLRKSSQNVLHRGCALQTGRGGQVDAPPHPPPTKVEFQHTLCCGLHFPHPAWAPVPRQVLSRQRLQKSTCRSRSRPTGMPEFCKSHEKRMAGSPPSLCFSSLADTSAPATFSPSASDDSPPSLREPLKMRSHKGAAGTESKSYPGKGLSLTQATSIRPASQPNGRGKTLPLRWDWKRQPQRQSRHQP